MKSRKNACRWLVFIGCSLLLIAFIYAVIPTAYKLPWQSEKEWLANGLSRLVMKLKYLANGDSESAEKFDDSICYYLTNMHLNLLSVETNNSEITYTIQHDKRYNVFKRMPVLITIGLVQTNDTNTLLIRGVPEALSKRLQFIFSQRDSPY